MDRPTDPPAPLALSGVSAGYEPNERDRVLDAVDLELTPGTITGLLGRNGSGKTTLMRVALGLMRARTGTARYCVAKHVDCRRRGATGFSSGFRGWR